MTTNATRDAALAYLAAGIAALPCCGPKQGKKNKKGELVGIGKAPHQENWAEIVNTPETLAAAWKRHPESNVGVVTGIRSKLVCIDIDPRNGGLAWLMKHRDQLIDAGGHEEVTGANGIHFWFRHPGGYIASRMGKKDKGIAPGVDLLADGGHQAIVAPSTHECGGVYRWAGTMPLEEIPDWGKALPSWIAEPGPAPIVEARKRDETFTDLPANVELCRARLAAVAGAVEGQAGDTATLQAAYLGRDHSLSPAAFLPLLQEWNATCTPPWDAADLETKMANAYRYAKSPAPGAALPENDFRPVPPSLASPVEEFAAKGCPTALGWRAVAAAHPKLREPLIDGLLRRGEVMNLIAAPKVGKSWLALSLAFAMAQGVPWLGRNTAQGVTLYVDNELHPETWAHRAGMVGELHQHCEGVYLMALRGVVRPLEDMIDAIAAEAKRLGAAVIILDAFYRFLRAGMSENDNAAMTQLSNLVDRLAKATGAAVVLIHHTSKGSQGEKSVTDVGAGASALARAADTHLALREHEQEGCVVFDVVTRSWPQLPSFVIQRTGGIWTRIDGADPAKLKGRLPTAKTSEAISVEQIEPIIPEAPASRAAIMIACKAAGLQITKEALLVRLDQAVEAGKAVRTIGPNRTVLYGRHAPAGGPAAPAGTQAERCAAYLREHPEAPDGEVAKAVSCTTRTVRRVRAGLRNAPGEKVISMPSGGPK